MNKDYSFFKKITNNNAIFAIVSKYRNNKLHIKLLNNKTIIKFNVVTKSFPLATL